MSWLDAIFGKTLAQGSAQPRQCSPPPENAPAAERLSWLISEAERLRAAGDQAGLEKVMYLQWRVNWEAGNIKQALRAAEQWHEVCKTLGDPAKLCDSMILLATHPLQSLPVTERISRLVDILNLAMQHGLKEQEEYALRLLRNLPSSGI